MGDVIASDAKGRFSVGTIDVNTITQGQEYLLTLSVNKAFLTDKTTAYPVTVSPTLTVSDSANGANAIEEITIYSGVPDANCNWTSAHCGYYDSAYKLGRTLFRLKGLISSNEYKAVKAANIASVEVHMQKAGGTAVLPSYIYSNSGSSAWTENAATWNNADHQLGTVYATAFTESDQYTVYNITGLVKAWKNNNASAEAGFVLASADESFGDKAFDSVENFTASYRPYVVVTYTASYDFSGAVNVTTEQTVSVNITAANQKQYFKFTPSVTGFYTFESIGNTGDPMVWLYNTNEEQIGYNDDSVVGDDSNYALSYHLFQNKTYYIAAGHYGTNTGPYSMTVTAGGHAVDAEYADFGTGYSININAAYAAQFYKVEVSTSGNYIFKSSIEVGDAKIWIYSASFMYLTEDNDSGGSKKFSKEMYLSANTTYYIVVGHHGTNTGSYGFNALMPITIPDGINHLQNIGTGLYLDIQGPTEQALAHQWSLHTGAQQRWEIKRQGEYYTIQSQYGDKKYLGINNTGIVINNVVLLSSANTDYALWKIYGSASGVLWIEPKLAPGKVICVYGTSEGTELQLAWMGVNLSDRNKWRISAQWDIVLEGQRKERWCWAASARMFAGSVGNVPTNRTQEEAVTAIRGSEVNAGGNLEQAMKATKYYISGNPTDGSQDYTYKTGYIFEEDILRRFLDEGHALYIGKAVRIENIYSNEGHAYVIGGYTSCVFNRTLTYQFIIFDPWPANPPNPWPNDPTSTTGQIYTASYQWLSTGQKLLPSDKKTDNMVWREFLTEITAYSNTYTPSP